MQMAFHSYGDHQSSSPPVKWTGGGRGGGARLAEELDEEEEAAEANPSHRSTSFLPPRHRSRVIPRRSGASSRDGAAGGRDADGAPTVDSRIGPSLPHGILHARRFCGCRGAATRAWGTG